MTIETSTTSSANSSATPSVTQRPVAPSPEAPRGSSPSRHAAFRWLTWAVVVVAIAAAAALAFLTVAGGSDDSAPDVTPVPGAHSGLVEHGSIRSIEGSVEDTVPARDGLPGDRPVANSGLAEHGSVRSVDGSVEDTTPRPGSESAR